jgi:hypothetical protein
MELSFQIMHCITGFGLFLWMFYAIPISAIGLKKMNKDSFLWFFLAYLWLWGVAAQIYVFYRSVKELSLILDAAK